MAIYDDQEKDPEQGSALMGMGSLRDQEAGVKQTTPGSSPVSAQELSDQEKDPEQGSALMGMGSLRDQKNDTANKEPLATGGAAEKLGKGYTGGPAAGAGNVLQKLQGSLKKHKKGAALGGAGGGAALLIFFGFAAIVPYELVHMEQDLLKHIASIEQYVEKKASNKLLKNIVKNNTDKSTASEEAAAEDADKNGEELTAEMDDFSFTNEDVEQALAKQGISVETDASGNFTGLKNAQGEDITDLVGSDPVVDNAIQTALPEFDVDQMERFRPTLANEAGSSWNILPDNDDENAQDDIDQAVREGASADDIAATDAAEDDTATDQSATPTDAADQAVAGTQSGEVGKITSAVEAGEAKGLSEADIIKSVDKDVDNPGSSLSFGQILNDVCEVEEVSKVAAKARIPTIITALIRHFTTILSLASQLKTGKVTGQEVNQTMQIYNGDPSAPKNSEAALPFSASAEYQMDVGNPVTTHTPSINPAALPTANAAQEIVDDITGVFSDIPGANLTCNVVTSRWGIIFQFGLGTLQGLADFFSGGEAEEETLDANLALQAEIQTVVVPDIVNDLTPVGVSGAEDSVQWFNNAGAGGGLAFGNYSRSLGAEPVSYSEADTLTTEANNSYTLAEANLPWATRTFALSDPDSLVSTIVGSLPMNFSSTVLDISNFFTRIPSLVAKDFASIFSGKALAQTPTESAVQPYGVTQYAFTDSTVNQYDPIANEQYLFGTVTAPNGNSATRISMLGNPNTYTPTSMGDGTLGDSNSGDLLHCFVDSFLTIEENNDNASQYCGSVGSYDYVGAYGSATNPPTNLPDDSTVAQIYCADLDPKDPTCPSVIMSDNNDVNDVGHFTQYLLDTGVMSAYTSLTNDQ